MNRLDLSGYEVVRAQYFATLQNPAMTISNGKLRFNTACLKKFEDVEYVELLLNSVDRCIAIRPCEKDNPNAIRWGRLKEGRWCASTLGCRGLAKALFDMMEWEEGLKYRFRGQLVGQNDDKLMLFELDEPEMVKVEEIVLPSKEQDEEGKPSSRRSISSRQNGQVLLENRSQVLHRLAFCSWNIMQETGMCSGRQQR